MDAEGDEPAPTAGPEPQVPETGTGAGLPAPLQPLAAALQRATARPRALVRRVWGFLEPKAPDLADLFMVAVIALTVGLSLWKRDWIFTGHALTASMAGFALCYLICSRGLRRHKGVGLQRVFISLAVMVSGVWLYEIAYHYAFPGSLAFLAKDAGTFSINTPTGGRGYPLIWSLVMVALAFVGARFMRVNRWFWLTLALSVATFWIWIRIGYPNYFHPEWWPTGTPTIDLFPRSYQTTRTPDSLAIIAFWGGLMNSITKVLVSVLPATLFIARLPGSTPAKGGPLRALRSAAARVLSKVKPASWSVEARSAALAPSGPAPEQAPVARASAPSSGGLAERP